VPKTGAVAAFASRQMATDATIETQTMMVRIVDHMVPPCYFRLLDKFVNFVDSLVPTAVTAVTRTTDIRAGINPYSMAVVPKWS
jgi:hypothetical protein